MPLVSVVVGVYNGVEALEKTLDNLLAQQDVDFEVVVVDDGSTDGSREMLVARAQGDSRLRYDSFSKNTGLTAALVQGCKLARGAFIARQDVGDWSSPNRLSIQARYLSSHPEACMVACDTQFVEESGQLLFDVAFGTRELTRSLKQTSLTKLRGPPHPSVMFRTDAYHRVGGYRVAFRVAQDLDLWTRMVEVGEVHSLSDCHVITPWAKGSISHRKQKQQVLATKFIIQAMQLRQLGRDDAQLTRDMEAGLDELEQVTDTRSAARVESDYHYFVGGMLDGHCSQKALLHYLRCIGQKPFHWKAWAKLLRALVGVLRGNIRCRAGKA